MKLLKLLFLFIYMPAAQLTAQYPFSKKIAIEEENLTLKANAIIKDQNGFLQRLKLINVTLLLYTKMQRVLYGPGAGMAGFLK